MFHSFLHAKSAQAECVRMLTDCLSTSCINFAAFTIDRQDIIRALKEAASLGAQVRVLVDKKNTLRTKVRDQCRLMGELCLPTTRLEVRVLEGHSLRGEYAAAGRHYPSNFIGRMHCKFVRVDRELLMGS